MQALLFRPKWRPQIHQAADIGLAGNREEERQRLGGATEW